MTSSWGLLYLTGISTTWKGDGQPFVQNLIQQQSNKKHNQSKMLSLLSELLTTVKRLDHILEQGRLNPQTLHFSPANLKNIFQPFYKCPKQPVDKGLLLRFLNRLRQLYGLRVKRSQQQTLLLKTHLKQLSRILNKQILDSSQCLNQIVDELLAYHENSLKTVISPKVLSETVLPSVKPQSRQHTLSPVVSRARQSKSVKRLNTLRNNYDVMGLDFRHLKDMAYNLNPQSSKFDLMQSCSIRNQSIRKQLQRSLHKLSSEHSKKESRSINKKGSRPKAGSVRITLKIPKLFL